MRRLTCAAFAIACLSGAWSCGGAHAPRARHVIVISMDTSRADHFGFLGSTKVKTPRLDALARESVVFTDCMTAAPTTLASHTSLFTGKYPHHHGTARNGFMVNPENVMLAEVLKSAGFRTAGFAGSFALGSRFDFDQGFDDYDETFETMVGDEGADQNQRSAASVTDAVIGYLDRTGVPDHLFLFAHYFDPHQPYAPPEEYLTAYDPQGNRGMASIYELKTNPNIPLYDKKTYARRYGLHYAAEITYMDHHIGRLLDDLRARGVLDEALLVVTSDHGENLWYHPEQFNHGHRVYQSTMHTVCLFRLPHGESGGTRIGSLISNIDVMPTILRSLGLGIPAHIDGEAVDLRAPIEPPRPRVRFGQATKPWSIEVEGEWPNLRKSRCVRDGRYKYIQNPLLESEELYDLEADPDETHDLLEAPTPETPVVAERLRKRLEAWVASAAPLPSEFERAQAEETLRRLKSLGYIN